MYKINKVTNEHYKPGDLVVYKGNSYNLTETLVKVNNIEDTDASVKLTCTKSNGEKVIVNFWKSEYGTDPNIFIDNGTYKLAEIEVNDNVIILGFEYFYSNQRQINPVGGYQISNEVLELTGDVNKSKLLEAINKMIDLITDEKLKQTCIDGLESFYNEFTVKPAANKYHHNYVGGLLQHTYEVMAIALKTSTLFKVNQDVIIASAFFHDIMKVKEYADDGNYLPYGSKVGHVVGSTFEFLQIANYNHVDYKIVAEIEHCLLSHHGRLEWGSPVKPTTIEAVILHCADLMSSQLNPVMIEGTNELKDYYINY